MNKLYSTLNKINNILRICEMTIGCLCLFILIIVMLTNAGGRYLINHPILWSDELNNILFVWFGFLACSYIMSEDKHLRITALINLFPDKLYFAIRLFMNIVMFLLFFNFIKPLFFLLKKVTFTGIMRLPLKYVYFILPLCFCLMCYHIICNVLKDLCNLKYNKKVDRGDA